MHPTHSTTVMKIFRLLPVVIIAFFAISWFSKTRTGEKPVRDQIQVTSAATNPPSVTKKLKDKAIAAKQFTERKGYNENICVLIDMSLPSGKNRFFVYNLQKDSVQARGLVAHGNCFENWLEGRRYSNVVGSGCTSLGKYKIGLPYTGKFGYSYKLHGLDTTNNNAFERTVVLHSHSCVPSGEISDDICQSNGCPTVSPDMLAVLKPIINNSRKPILLWIYDK